jgi:tyrosyl-tRNA synthetase
MMLAKEITGSFYGDDAAVKAEDAFVRLFQEHDIPEEMPEYLLKVGQTVVDVLTTAGLAASNSEARRLVQQGGVRLDGEQLDQPQAVFPHTGVLRVGKRKFVRVVDKG